MAHFNIAISGLYDINLPKWGRCFWQSPTDGELFLAFASGTSEVFYTTSSDSGVSWAEPLSLFPVDDFSTHGNFDIFMDPRDHIHCVFRYNGSGCYKFLGKVDGGGWSDASGVGVVPFTLVGDSGTLGGFQGSVTVTEKDFGGDLVETYPLTRIGVKTSTDDVTTYYMSFPHNSGYLVEDSVGGPNAGTNGGFPIVYNDCETGNGGLVYYNDTDGTIECYVRSFGWTSQSIGPIVLGNGAITPNERLAFGSGVKQFNDGIMLVTSSSGHDIYGSTYDAFNVQWESLEQLEESGVWPWKSGVPFSGIYGISDGTRFDFSFDDSGSTHLYYLAQDEVGHYSICRVLQTTVLNNIDFEYNYYYSDQHPSGLKYVATASITTAGGKDNRVCWDSMKAVKHPLSPGDTRNDVSKGQFVVTQGLTATSPSGGILTVWNLENAPGTKEFQQPYFRIDYTATSGDPNGPFVGINSVFFSTNSNNMFDQNTTSYGLFANGSYIYLEFDRILEIDKIDVQGTRVEDIGQIDVYTSLDDVTYTHVGTIPSGNPSFNYLRRLTSDQDSLTDASYDLSYKWDPVSAKYVYMLWTTTYGSSGRRIGEIRIFGPAATSGGLYTYGTEYTHNPPPQSPFTEEFKGHEGTLPAEWATYGDYGWGIVASGEFTRLTGLPSTSTPPGYDGLIPSGRYEGTPRGSGDGFSVRNTPDMPAGSSGVLLSKTFEVTTDESIAGGKVISFDYLLDMHPDDVFGVYIDDGTIVMEVTGIRRDWTTKSHTITTGIGDYKVRFVYTRGATNIAGSIGAAWVDNFVGLTGPYLNSIHGFVQTEAATATGLIYGYLNANMSDSIYGYLYGAPLDSTIYGYLSSAVSPNVTANINGWLNAKGTWVNGYLLATSGVDATTYPTGAILGYVKVLDSGALSSIYGYVDGRGDHAIHGYTLGAIDPTYPTGDTRIFGYVYAVDAYSAIYGLVNGSGENTITTSINGYLCATGDEQVIYGYVLGPSGHLESILGYAGGWDGGASGLGANQSAIYGYLAGPTDSGTVEIFGYVRATLPFSSIYGYLGSEALVPSGYGAVGGGPGGGTSTSNVTPGMNWIHGYLKGEEGFQYIYGYVMGPLGGISDILGYVSAGASENEIWGYSIGHETSSGTIYGVLSGIYFESSEINGYIFGVSGYETSDILGYVEGAGYSTSSILGTMIGSLASSSGSRTACPSHTFSLVSVPVVVIPSSCMNEGI